MAKKMLIDATHAEETRVVVIDGNKVDEFDFETASRRPIVGNIYLAKVTRVEPSLQAAFVDYGGNRHGFLAFSEIHPDYYQIPVADREALLAEEEARARQQAEEEEKSAKKATAAAAAKQSSAEEDAPDAEVAEVDAPEAEADADAVEEITPDPEPEPDPGAVKAAAEGSPSDNDAVTRSDDAVEAKEPASDGDAAKPEAEAAEATPDAPAAKPKSSSRSSSRSTSSRSASSKSSSTKSSASKSTSKSASSKSSGSGSKSSSAKTTAKSTSRSRSSTAKKSADKSTEIVEVDEDAPVRRSRPRRYKIQEVVKVRQIMLVQVVKEERGNKGAALTTYLSLAGRYCVLMPNTARGGGISRKITSATDRRKLKEIAADFSVPQGAGLIIRTAGAKRTKTEIKRDYEYLMRQWEQIRDVTLKSIAPTLIYEEGSLIKRAIRDLYGREIDEVLVEGPEAYREAKDYMKMLMPSHAKNVKLYSDRMPLFMRYPVETFLGAMFNPTVQLRSGGYIVIGITEALIAIDVNSGRSTREGSIEETALKTNLEAAEEIARQLRLRDLAGLIVIDFIDMDERRNNSAVEKMLKEKLKGDRARLQVGRISTFGLLEMSRQRLRTGMLEASTALCPHCHGTGRLRSNDSLALSILRELEEEGTRKRSAEALLSAPVEVINYLINHKREYLDSIETRYGLSVRLEADPSLVSPEYRVERFKTALRQVTADPDKAPIQIDSSAASMADEDVSEGDDAPETPVAAEGDGGDGTKKKRRRRRRRPSSANRNGAGDGQGGEAQADGDARPATGNGDGRPPSADAVLPVLDVAEDRRGPDMVSVPEGERASTVRPPASANGADAEAEAEATAPPPVEAPEQVAAEVQEDPTPVADPPTTESASTEAPTADAPSAAAPEPAAPEATPDEPTPEDPAPTDPDPGPTESGPKRRGWWSRALGGGS
ncbi:MAG: Rne/Rng family ribonuclease [Pseudomonadota bacterium]